MVEIWRDIKGFEGKYQVSNKGKIRSNNMVVSYGNVSYLKPGRLLIPLDNGNGYLGVNIGTKKREYIHRLVANEFISNPENKKNVNHKDGNKSNNCAENLEWVTSSENNLHAWITGLNKSYDRKGLKNPNFKNGNSSIVRKKCACCQCKYNGRAISKFCSKSCRAIYINNKLTKVKIIS